MCFPSPTPDRSEQYLTLKFFGKVRNFKIGPVMVSKSPFFKHFQRIFLRITFANCKFLIGILWAYRYKIDDPIDVEPWDSQINPTCIKILLPHFVIIDFIFYNLIGLYKTAFLKPKRCFMIQMSHYGNRYRHIYLKILVTGGQCCFLVIGQKFEHKSIINGIIVLGIHFFIQSGNYTIHYSFYRALGMFYFLFGF